MPLLLLSLPCLSRSRLRMTILLWLPTKGVLRKLNKDTRHASGLPVDKPRPLCRQLWVKERTPKSRGMAPRLCSSAVLLLGTRSKNQRSIFSDLYPGPALWLRTQGVCFQACRREIDAGIHTVEGENQIVQVAL